MTISYKRYKQHHRNSGHAAFAQGRFLGMTTGHVAREAAPPSKPDPETQRESRGIMRRISNFFRGNRGER